MFLNFPHQFFSLEFRFTCQVDGKAREFGKWNVSMIAAISLTVRRQSERVGTWRPHNLSVALLSDWNTIATKCCSHDPSNPFRSPLEPMRTGYPVHQHVKVNRPFRFDYVINHLP